MRPLLVVALLVSLLGVACTNDDAKPAARAAHLVTLRYDVGGMHCDGCVQAITAEVMRVKGVQRCEVSLEEKRAVVDLTDAALAPEVEKAITKLGYTVTRKG